MNDETVWMCEQLRAGVIYNKVTFHHKHEAEEFIARMEKMEPDLFWRMEAVEARQGWN